MRILLALALMTLPLPRLLACSCATPGTPCAAAGISAAVFTATVLAVTDPVWPRPVAIPGSVQSARRSAVDPPITLERPLRTVRMQVREVLSGIASAQKEIEIGTGMGGGDCGIDFKIGADYVVYAYKNGEGRLETGICSRTRMLSQAAEDLEYIRARANAPATVQLHVRTAVGSTPGIPGLAVSAQGNGSRYPALTNAAGEATFPSLPPGSYIIHADRDGDLPDDPKLELHAKGCVDVALFRALRLEGRVTTKSGEPAARIEVQVRSAKGAASGSATTDPDGRYQLRILEAGQYYLGVNLNNTANRYTPYPRWFYPGTAGEASAIPISFSGRPESRTYDFALPDPQPERTIEGIVSRPDGQPAPRVVVTILDTSRTVVAQAFADQSGRFSARVFASTAYRLHAVWPGNGTDAAASAAPVEIEPGTATLTLRLTLIQPGNSWLDEQQPRR